MNLLFLGLGVLLATQGASRRTDGYQVQGTWKIQSTLEDGRELPTARESAVRWHFQGAQCRVTEDQESVSFAYQFDLSRSPKRIEIIPSAGPNKGKALIGIYQMGGGNLQICLPLRSGQDVPGDFSARPGSGRVLLILKRDK